MWHAHGEYTLLSFKQVFYIRPTGSWNLDCAKAYLDAIKAELADWPDIYRPMLAIVDLRYWDLGTPEVMQHLSKAQDARQSQGIEKFGDIYISQNSLPAKISKREFIKDDQAFWHLKDSEPLASLLETLPIETDIPALIRAVETDELEPHATCP